MQSRTVIKLVRQRVLTRESKILYIFNVLKCPNSRADSLLLGECADRTHPFSQKILPRHVGVALKPNRPDWHVAPSGSLFLPHKEAVVARGPTTGQRFTLGKNKTHTTEHASTKTRPRLKTQKGASNKITEYSDAANQHMTKRLALPWDTLTARRRRQTGQPKQKP